MITPIHTPAVIQAGETKVIPLPVDAMRVNNAIGVTSGSSGVLSFRHKVLFGQLETAEAPNSIDLADKKSIMFNGAALEAIEITNGGSDAVTVTITQS